MKTKMICFMGLDGSGKSTSIEHAYQQLKKEGKKVKIVRAAYVAVISRFFIKIGKRILLKKNADEYKDYNSYLKELRKNANKGFVYRVFSFLTTIEFKAQIFFRIRMNRFFGYNLLVDRYVYDNVVTYAANLGLGKEYMVKTMNTKWKRSPKPDLIIYIKTPVDICFSRKDDTPSELYLEIREPLYDIVSDLYNAKIISGEQPKENMLKETVDAISSLF